MKELTLINPDQTMALGQQIARQLQAGDVIVLNGDLGAGKTTFTKGLAQGLGVQRVIKSPTFTIIREYLDGRLPLYHMDVYRLENGGGDELGLDEYFDGDGVSVVEWAQFVEEDLPTDYLSITFTRQDQAGNTVRLAEVKAVGDRFQSLVAELKG